MSSASARLPIWLRPEPRTRRPRFSRDQIAAAALKIADEEGYDAVSMRRVAAELGSGTMTLYHYVRTKEDLVALMDDAIMGQVLIPADEMPSSWRAALTAIARRSRAVFLRHRWALLGLRSAIPGPNGMRHFEQSLAAVAELPVESAVRQQLLLIVDDFVFGHVLRTTETLEMPEPDSEAFEAIRAFGEAQLATGEYPHIGAMIAHRNPERRIENEVERIRDEWGSREVGDARFEMGLAMLLDGAAHRLNLPD